LFYVGVVRCAMRLKYIPEAAARLKSISVAAARLKYIPVAAATGMYFNLIAHQTTPTYNNETTTHNNPHNHTQPTHRETYLNNTTHCYST